MRRLVALCFVLVALSSAGTQAEEPARRLLYVASPGVLAEVEWGGRGILVYDIDRGHELVRRIPSPFEDVDGKAEKVKGIAAHAATGRLYLTSVSRLAAMDLVSEEWLWTTALEDGGDRLAVTPDGRSLYVPSWKDRHWKVVDAASGRTLERIETPDGAHNTLILPGGSVAYLASLEYESLMVVDLASRRIVSQVGPFSDPIRPFTVSERLRRVYVNVDRLLGFEVGDLDSGRRLWRVEIPGFDKGEKRDIKRHRCPSHGIALTPDESELWVVDAPNQRLHVFDATVDPPAYDASIVLEVDQPGWITFTIRGDYAYPSTGEVIDAASRAIVTQLVDEEGRPVQSEKMLEIQFAGDVPARIGDQFGIGRRTE